jgi:hypothetical protein
MFEELLFFEVDVEPVEGVSDTAALGRVPLVLAVRERTKK